MHRAVVMDKRTTPVAFRRGRIDGLDGLRALAVGAVLAFHLDPELVPGGFIGVDVFFVVSGFLITTLLIREFNKTGAVDLVAFWQRRIRRLIPALVVTVLTSVSVTWLLSLFHDNARDLLYGIGRQLLGTATFTSNWLEIAAGSSYFDSRVPQLFSPFWSLAVEEQFYLFWPLLFLLSMRLVPAPRLRACIAVIIALASALRMALVYDPSGDATRVYYGTDTHLFGLMLGVAIAFEFSRFDAGLFGTRWWRQFGSLIGASGIGILFILFFLLGEAQPVTFYGGLGLASLASGMAIAGILSGPSRYTRILDLSFLRWIGERSYGIYIWHWPVILLLDVVVPTSPGSLGGFIVQIVAIAVTLGLSEASLRIVETPMRREGIRATLGSWRSQLPSNRLVQVGAAVTCLGMGATTVAAVTAPDMTSVEAAIQAEASQVAALKPTANPTPDTATQSHGDPSTREVDYTPPRGEELTIFGDSMAVTSVDGLVERWPGLHMDAESNRRWEDVIPIADALNAQSAIRRAVVFMLGTNWGIQDPVPVEGLIDRIQHGRTVVLVNSFGAGWEPQLTQQLQAITDKYPNVEVADWESVARGNPDKLQADGVHPDFAGIPLMAEVIAAAFDRLAARGETGATGRTAEIAPTSPPPAPPAPAAILPEVEQPAPSQQTPFIGEGPAEQIPPPAPAEQDPGIGEEPPTPRTGGGT
ncbi:acyltransferase family protein [Corynebacterium sp. SCR221107]|uniref:acyltransferase family protein n=1 Tax=Corynebacterium sp. SCR221107 TaxID=3017361 RepID=UPI0022EC342F|nr:acyltransferase family protein [Corynebacterium sp. SCR221107]WBT07679.1 acyltransferase family protein [Corynebacterium sp. SCR221107]